VCVPDVVEPWSALWVFEGVESSMGGGECGGSSKVCNFCFQFRFSSWLVVD